MMKYLFFLLFMPLVSIGQQFSKITLTHDDEDVMANFHLKSNNTIIGNKLYFYGMVTTSGNSFSGLWSTDGTPDGSEFIYSFTTQAQGRPSEIFSHNNKLFISAKETDSNELYGVELWISDGTPAGTKLLKDINPGKGHSNPANFTSMGNHVYFTAENASGVANLWKTDGSEAGTQLVSTVKAVGPIIYDNVGTLYFSGFDNINGTELWKTDGTGQGTKIVKDIRTGIGSSTPDGFTLYNGKVYFRAHNGTGIQLFVTDGTESGTKMVKTIRASGDPEVNNLKVFNGELYFSANDGINGLELWKTDGTEQGTNLVRNISNSAASSLPSSHLDYQKFTVMGDALYFISSGQYSGYELWKTDGTYSGTRLVKDIYPGNLSSHIRGLTTANGKLYFSAWTNTEGIRMFESDGTNSGTFPITPEDATNEYPINLSLNAVALNNGLIFTADFYGDGQKLWRYGDEINSVVKLTQDKLLLYPNPVNNVLQIDLGKMHADITIEIMNSNGQIVEIKKLKSSQQLNLNVLNLSSGLYFITAITGEGVLNSKFIKE